MRALVSLSGAMMPAGVVAAINQPASLIAPGEVPPGAFHGRSIPEASVLYLRMVKQKQKASEIATALRRGGIETQSSDFNNQVHAALDRASKKKDAEIIKLHGAYWALREWLSASVRASMASGAPFKKNNKRTKKRKAPTTIEGKVEAPKPKQEPKMRPNGSAHAETTTFKAPEAGTTEGRILDAMRKDTTKDWSASEVATAAGIPRVQTAHFLLGKLAFRKLVQKTESGTFRVP